MNIGPMLAGFGTGLPHGIRAGTDLARMYQEGKNFKGQELFGNSFMDMFNQQVPPGTYPMPPMPGQPSTPAGDPWAGMTPERPGTLVSQMPGLPPMPGQPSQLDTAQWPSGPVGAPPSMAFAPPGGPTPMGPGGPAMSPGAPMAPTGPGGPPAAPTGPAPAPGTLNWRQVVQAIRQRDPNADGATIAAAVQRFQPIMSQESQREWRMMQLDMREENLRHRSEVSRMLEEGRNARFADREAGLTDRFGRRENRYERTEEERTRRFNVAEDRRAQSLAARIEDRKASLERNLSNDRKRWDTAAARLDLQTIEADSRAHHRYVMEQLGTQDAMKNIPKAERARMMAEEKARYEATTQELNGFKQRMRGGEPTKQPAARTPELEALPPEIVAQLKEGAVTTLRNTRDGSTVQYTLRNGQPVKVD